MTKRELAKTDQEFLADCEAAGVYPSRNQYGKWKHKRGLAYLTAHGTRRQALDSDDDRMIAAK